MIVQASVRVKNVGYELVRDTLQGWFLVRTKAGKEEYFPLDHDKRHQRFFLEEADQRYVGVDGIVALEKMTREVLRR